MSTRVPRNFSLSVNGASVTCSSPCQDSLPLDNLTSASAALNRRGFLADYYVKPPVAVTLEWPFSIRVKRLRLSGRVGQQRAKYFEVWAREGDGRENLLFRGEVNPSSADSLDLRSDWRGPAKPGHGRLRYVRSGGVRHLTIKIKGTFATSTPGFSDLHIEADPVNRGEMMRCLRAVGARSASAAAPEASTSFMYRDTLATDQDEGDVSERVSAPISTPLVAESVSEPDVIVDAVTEETARIPIVLPCGQIVDQSTLDRYLLEEERMGRAPNDPFTRTPFTSESRPILLNARKK